jgi:hypothetical protein
MGVPKYSFLSISLLQSLNEVSPYLIKALSSVKINVEKGFCSAYRILPEYQFNGIIHGRLKQLYYGNNSAPGALHPITD